MNQLPLFLLVLLAVYLLANCLTARYLWRTLRQTNTVSRRWRWPFIMVWAILASAYPLTQWGPLAGTPAVYRFGFIGGLWLAFVYYLVWLFGLLALWRRFDRRRACMPSALRRRPVLTTVTAVCLSALLVTAGAWNARHPLTRTYEITIPKADAAQDTLTLVFVSDLHLGNPLQTPHLNRMVNRINQLDPDIVVLGGDVIDNKLAPVMQQHAAAALEKLRPRLATYAVLGNHEYFERRPETVIAYLAEANINVLRDEWVQPTGTFYLIGRDDLARQRYLGTARQELPTLLQDVDRRQPLLLIDHQPKELLAAAAAGIDLQLSGHTHLGQIFPNNYLTALLYPLDWGYGRFGTLQAVVSCGIGTWGPPVRLGNHPEIVKLTIHFTPPAAN